MPIFNGNQLPSLTKTHLVAIIKQQKSFPELYRNICWRFLLALPANEKRVTQFVQEYKIVVQDQDNNIYLPANALHYIFDEMYPISQRNLKNRVSNVCVSLYHWSPCLAQTVWLPKFVFPFIKFYGSSLAPAFETCVCLLKSFEIFVTFRNFLPNRELFVINCIIENHFVLHNDQKTKVKDAQHFNNGHPCMKNMETQQKFIFNLFTGFFTDQLAANEWLQLMDHIFLNQSVFFVYIIMACFTAKEMQLECKHRVSGRLLNLNRIDDLLRASYAIMGAFNKRGTLDVFGDAARGDVEINAADISAIEDFDKDFTMIQLIQVDINKLPEAINTPQMKIRDMQSEVKAVEKLFDQKYDQSMAGAKADQEKQLKEQKQLMDERKQLQQIMQSQQAQSKVRKPPGGSKPQPPSTQTGQTNTGAGTTNTGTTAKQGSKQQVSFTLNTDDGNAGNADSVEKQLHELERQFQPHSVLADDKGITNSNKSAQVNRNMQNSQVNQEIVTKSTVQEKNVVKNTFNQVTDVERLERQLDNKQNLRPKNDLFKTRDDLMRSKSKMGSSAAETLLKRLGEVRRPEGYVQQRSGLEQSGTSGPSGPKTDESLAATSLKSSAGILRNKSDDTEIRTKHQHEILESTIVLQRVEQPEQPVHKNHAQVIKQQKQLQNQIQEQLENQQQVQHEKEQQKDESDGSHDVQSIFKRKVDHSSHTLTSSSNQRTPSIMKDSTQPNKDQIALSEADEWRPNEHQKPAKKPFIKTQTQSQIKKPTTTSNEEIKRRQMQLNQRIKRIQEQQQIQTGKSKEQKLKTDSTVDKNVEDDNIIVESTDLTATLSKSQKVSQSQKQSKLGTSKQDDIQKQDLTVSKSSRHTQKDVENYEENSKAESSQEEDLTNTMVATGYSKAPGTKQDIVQTLTQRMTDHDDVSQINNRSIGSSDDQVTELIQQAQQITQPERPVEDVIKEYKEVESAQKKLLKINGLQSSGASQLTKDSSASSIDSNAGVVKHDDINKQSVTNAFAYQNQQFEQHQNNYSQYNLSQKTFPGNDGRTQMQQSSLLPSAILPVGVPISNPNVMSQTNYSQTNLQNPAQLQSNINQLQEESDRYQQSMRQRLANIESQLYDNQRRAAQNPTLMSLNQTAISEANQPAGQLGVDSITSMQRTQQLFDQSRRDLQNQIQARVNINAPQVTLPPARSAIVPHSVSVSNVVHGSDSGNEDFDPLISRRIASQVMQKSVTPAAGTAGVSKLAWNAFDKSSTTQGFPNNVAGSKSATGPSIVPAGSFFTAKDAGPKPDQSMTGTVMSNTTDYKVFLDDLQNQVHNIQNKLQQISSLAESSGDAEAEMAKIRADVAARNAASLVNSDSFATDGVGSRYGNRTAGNVQGGIGASTTMGTSVTEMRNRFGSPRLDRSISSSGVNSSGVSQSLLDRVQRNNAALLAQMSSRVSDIDSDAHSDRGIEIDVDTDDD